MVDNGKSTKYPWAGQKAAVTGTINFVGAQAIFPEKQVRLPSGIKSIGRFLQPIGEAAMPCGK